MPTLLALTVGGSCAPVVTAIKDYQPDFVMFIASQGPTGSRVTIDGPGNPCGDRRKVKCSACGHEVLLGNPEGAHILAQTGLRRDKCEILELLNPDDLPDCYSQLRAALIRLRQTRPDWRCLADYTGGTKTMTVALSLVALELGWELSIVRGNRTDLQKVRNGTEMASLVNTWEVRARQQLEQAGELFNQFAYASAGQLVKLLARSAPLSPELQRDTQKVVTLCRGFDAWDRFDHARAAQILQAYRDEVLPQWKMLKKILGEMKASGYEPVFDLFYNAERRAQRGRYDDAVARLYRSLEMLAQIRLRQRKPALNTSDLDVSLLPGSAQAAFAGKSGRIKLGLLEDYDLLAALDDPLGKFFAPHRKKLLAMLEKRNESILAHGIQPCNEDAYQEMGEQVWQFLAEGLKVLNIPGDGVQFPLLLNSHPVQRSAE
jgi:CRISPR-associated protein (TIGR02710 family)